MTTNSRPVIGITMGDPSGIGPEVVVQALLNPKLPRKARYLIIGEHHRIRQALHHVGLQARASLWSDLLRPPPSTLHPPLSHGLTLFDLENLPRPVRLGKVAPAYGKAAKEYLDAALRLIQAGQIQGLVTGPINKAAILKAGFRWIGHTEYLMAKTKTRQACMLLVGGPLRVALVTRDLAVCRVPRLITARAIMETTELLYHGLKRWFGITAPKIGIASLNPHAGDQGALGMEELDQIIPAILTLRRRGWSVEGPIPPDTLFVRAQHGEFDGEVAMYHDQALIPLKLLSSSEAVNVTLGLPFVRTSPAHGTAHDIAGKRRPDPTPMLEAIRLAAKLVRKATPH